MRIRNSSAGVLISGLFALGSAEAATTYSFWNFDPTGSTGFAFVGGLNDLGQVVGYYYDVSNYKHGFVGKQNAGFTTLIDSNGPHWTSIMGINDNGQISGHYEVPPAFFGFTYQNGTFTNVNEPASYGDPKMVIGINDFGDVTGWYTDLTSGSAHGFFFDGATWTQLDVPAAKVGPGFGTSAAGVNDSNKVVGYFQDAAGYHGFLWDGNAYTTLDVPGSVGTAAFSINDKNDIAGYYIDPQGVFHGFVYSNGAYTTVDNPNAAGSTQIRGINNSGQLAGAYTDASGATHGFVATPVVPATQPTAAPVLENLYDPGRTGANLQETALNTGNVNPAGFGRLFSYPVDGQIYAQPLYAPNVAVPGQGVRNVLYVATMNDILYAFDADQPGPPLWTVNFSNSTIGSTPVPIADIVGTNSMDIAGNVGIEGTPIIDPASNTLYLVARTKEGGNSVFRLYALDSTSGAI